MKRILIIGQTSSSWEQAIKASLPPHASVHLDAARLPSEGLRLLQAIHPDMIVIVDDRGGQRMEALLGAIKKRIDGHLPPVVFICPLPEGSSSDERAKELGLAGWFSPQDPPAQIVQSLFALLGIARESPIPVTEQAESNENVAQATEAPSPYEQAAIPEKEEPDISMHMGTPAGLFESRAQGTPGAQGPLITQHNDYILEELSPEVPALQKRGPRHGTLERQDSRENIPAVTAEAIERKLKAVRHEDYYAILEVRRGSAHQTIRDAFERLYRQFDSQVIEFELAHRFQDELAEIQDALEDTWAVLGDPGLRESYLAQIVRK